MHVLSSSLPAFWLSTALLITTALGDFPSLMPRRGFTIDSVRNEKHVPNGVSAKVRAMAKFAHLVDSSKVKSLDYDPCK